MRSRLIPAMLVAATIAVAAFVSACGDDGGSSDLSGAIRIDGSSTVAPLSEAVGEQFNGDNPDVKVTVGTSGTGGGFEKFCAGETDISDASRQIEPDEEKACANKNINYEEVTVANDALTVVVNKQNPVTCVSVAQLKQIFGPAATASSWGDVSDLDADFNEDLQIFSPGADSGTFDYFTEAVNGEEGEQRSKGVNVVGENDNATVTGVSGSAGGIGYFGFSFYNENQDKLKALQIKNPETGKCITPSPETTQSGDYAPLGRQLYIYPSGNALRQEAVKSFVDYYLDNANGIAEQVGYIALTDEQLQESKSKVSELQTGGGQ